MKRRVAVLFLCALAVLRAGDFRAGRAAVKITPPVGGTSRAKGVHDDIYAKALVLEQDGKQAAMITCDVTGITRGVVLSAREAVERSTGIPADRVMISATHSHTAFAPGLWGLERSVTPEAERYLASLISNIALATRRAQEDLKPVKVSAGKGQEPALVFNRRFLMKDGTTRFNPGFQNPDIVRPQGPVDPEVSVVYFESPQSEPLTTVVNYALHQDTTGSAQVSADYAYTLGRVLGLVKGESMLTIFNIGTAGNVNHWDVKKPGPQYGYSNSAAIGAILAGAVLKTCRNLEPIQLGPPQVAHEMVRFPMVEFKPEDVSKAEQILDSPTATLMERVWAQRVSVTAEAKRTGKPIEGEVQVIAVGPELAWVGLPAEIFVELGMAIKQASPYRFTIVNSLANDWLRYVPNRKGFAEGSYEATNTRGGPGTGELLVESAERLLVQLHGGGR